MQIEQSQLQLSAQSSLVRQEVRVRQVARPVTPAMVAPLSVEATPSVDFGDEPQGKLLLMLLIAEMMLGKKTHLFHVPLKGEVVAVQTPEQDVPQVEVRTIQVRAESQQVHFHATGSVQTADGRRIDFVADLALSRQFVEVVTGVGADGGSEDPLILNFDGRGVRLSGNRVSFDLNGDGQSELVPQVAPGSGVLFADRNADHVANDGTELFGPHSGDGFGELALQDTDANGWIDEGDPVFGELRVWFQDAAGPGSVYSLTDLGIGALSTSSAGTPFNLRSAGNALLGQIRNSGVYLREDGQAGTISHVDLAI